MHGYLSVRGHRLEYESWLPSGALDHRDIVLLHEGLGSVAAWRTFPADLAARTGWRVFAYSRQGYGASDSVALPRLTTFMHEEAIEETLVLPDCGHAPHHRHRGPVLDEVDRFLSMLPT